MKILRVIPRYAPAWRYGGSVRFCYDLDAALAARGLDITVYTSDQIDEYQRAPNLRDRLNGVEIRRFPNPWNALASRAGWLAFYPIGLARALRDGAAGFDLVHVTEARGPHVRWTFRAARAAGVPVVWSPLGGLADGVGIRRPYRRMYDVVSKTRDLVATATALVAQSPHERIVLQRMGAAPERVRHIAIGVDATRFAHLPARGAFRRSIGIGADRPMVLFVGRFHPNKGLDVLLRAAALTRRTIRDLMVVLVGWDHGALGTVTRLTHHLGLADAVMVVPPLFGNAPLEAYVDADVFAVACRAYEETSLAAMEAIAAGTPCVLTHQCEVADLERQGGGVVTNCDPDAFAAALVAILRNPSRRSAAISARQWILSAHSSERVADRHAEMYCDLLGRARADGRRAIARFPAHGGRPTGGSE